MDFINSTFDQVFPNYKTCLKCHQDWSKLRDGGLCADCENIEKEKTEVNRYIPKHFWDCTFNNYDCAKFTHSRMMYDAAESFMSPDNPKGLFISGKTAAGKTHIAYSIYKDLIASGCSVKVVDWASFIDNYMDYDRLTDEGKGLFNIYATCEYLIIDDLAAEHITSGSKSVINRLINERYLNKRYKILITSNWNLTIISDNISDRVSSRIELMCNVFNCEKPTPGNDN